MSSNKRVLVLSENWSQSGADEKYLLACIKTLLPEYDVTIPIGGDSIDAATLLRCFPSDVSAATFRRVKGSPSAIRCKIAALSGEFDLCIYMTNFRYFPSRAKNTIAILKVPYGRIPLTAVLSKLMRGKLREATKDGCRIRLMRKVRSGQTVVVYSQFVHDTLESIHGVQSHILHPPIDDFGGGSEQKEHLILSVGRIFRGLYNDKRYDVMIETFKKLRERMPHTSWQYRIVGNCGTDAASQRYLRSLQNAARGHPIYFSVNAPVEELKRYYNQASIFWHAAGFGVDESIHPDRMEHFGMSTVEAMSARCVPVVIGSGGQKEIVSHGKSGYLWSTIDEMIDQTTTLIEDPALLGTMQVEARNRSSNFSRENFSRKLLSLVQMQTA